MMLRRVAELEHAADLLPDLAWRLTRLGYAEYFKSFNPLSIGSARWLVAPVAAPKHIAPLVALLLLGVPVDRKFVAEFIGDIADDLIAAGILDEQDGRLLTPGLILIQIAGYWLFVSRPRPNALVYVGDDSVGLLWRQSVRPNGICLDLCTGPGLQALAASAHAAHVDAVEVNPVAMMIACLNVEMNRLAHRVSVHFGSLYAPVAGRRYDNILANPPFLPVPDSAGYPFVGAGGHDGLKVVREILAGLPASLAADGIAQIICAMPSNGRQPTDAPLAELREWCRQTEFDLLITIMSHLPMHRGSFFFEGMAQTATASGGGDIEIIRERLEAGCRDAGNSHIATCFLQAQHGSGIFRISSVGHPHGSLWFV